MRRRPTRRHAMIALLHAAAVLDTLTLGVPVVLLTLRLPAPRGYPDRAVRLADRLRTIAWRLSSDDLIHEESPRCCWRSDRGHGVQAKSRSNNLSLCDQGRACNIFSNVLTLRLPAPGGYPDRAVRLADRLRTIVWRLEHP